MHCEIVVLKTMAGADGNADKTSPDYERQYQEDLERAQALSLESLALEKFRLQKQQQQQFKFILGTSNGECCLNIHISVERYFNLLLTCQI
jgi:hypothetical protein